MAPHADGGDGVRAACLEGMAIPRRLSSSWCRETARGTSVGISISCAALALLVAGGCSRFEEAHDGGLVAGSEAGSEAGPIPERPFSELGGPYDVGVRDLFWVDGERDEPFTSDSEDRRRYLVRVWYPARLRPEDSLARYVPDPAEFDDAESFAGLEHVRTRGYADAEPNEAEGPYPVLIFNPGGGWTRLSDTFWTEQLTSHGYVVFALDHPGFNQSVVFPDGYRFAADRLPFPEETGDLLRDAHAAWSHLDEHHFPIWQADSRSLLDRIEEMNADPESPFRALLDLDRIGAFGWSFGGATAVQLSRDDPRVKAAVDGDGQLFGDVARTGTPRPVLLLHSEPDSVPAGDTATGEENRRATAMAELIAEVEANYRSLRAGSPQVWRVSIRGASHGSFSDLALMSPPSPGVIDPRRGHEIINALSLAFFDRTLKGAPGILLDRIESDIPEAFEVSRPQRRDGGPISEAEQ